MRSLPANSTAPYDHAIGELSAFPVRIRSAALPQALVSLRASAEDIGYERTCHQCYARLSHVEQLGPVNTGSACNPPEQFPWLALVRFLDRSVLDDINNKWGRGTLRVASVPKNPGWAMRRHLMSQSYTTRLDQLWTVKAI